MATSGTTSFNLTVNEIVESAYDLVGGEFITGWDAKLARRMFNLLLIDLQNRGHPLGKLEEVTVSVSTGDRDYTLDSSIIDVMHCVLRRDGVDTEMRRVGLFEDNNIPVKSEQGRPYQYTIDRDTSAVNLKVWPTPENTTDTLKIWAVKKIEDVTNARENVDLSPRFQPALVFGLAYFSSFKRPDMDVQKRQELKSNYEEMLDHAFGEDKERASFFVTPHLNRPR
jgi:hypothetical protein